MMEMQEVKERKRKTPAQDVQEPTTGDDEDVTDPTVPALGGTRKAKGSKSGGTWLGYIMDRLWSLVFFTVASLGLYEMHFVQEVLYAPEANRTFVHLGIFCCTLVVLFGCYIEIYRSMLLHEKVRYENAKSSTHGMLASIIATGVCLSIGMWPVWHWLTLPILFMWFWGVIVQAAVLLPVQLQRVVFAGAYFWFMHAYASQMMY